MKKSSLRKPEKSQPGPVTQRTCLGCREVKEKFQLVRVVRTPQGIELDPRGKKSGRGAYLCPRWGCWQQGLKGKRLAHALKGVVRPEELERLWQFARGLLKREEDGGES